MILGVVGSRDVPRYGIMEEELDKIIKQYSVTMIISVGDMGPDCLIQRYASLCQIPCKEMRPERIDEVIDLCDRLVAFWDGGFRGTTPYVVTKAVSVGTLVRVIRVDRMDSRYHLRYHL